MPAGRLIEGELIDRQRLIEALAEHRIDAVMHFAAFAYGRRIGRRSGQVLQNNVVASLSLLDAMRTARRRAASSFRARRPPTACPSACRSPRTNRSSRSIPMASAKLVIEQALADYAQAYGLGYAALRYFNAAGASADGRLGRRSRPGDPLDSARAASGAGPASADHDLRRRLSDARRHVHSRLHPRRRLGHRARRWRSNAWKPGAGLQLNLGTGRGHSVREVIDACRRVTGHADSRDDRPAPARRSARAGRRLAAGSASRWPGDPRYMDIESIVRTAWKWHSAHPHGYGT